MAGTRLVAAAGSVLEEEGDIRDGGGGTAGGGGGTTSWVFDEAVGEPGGGAGMDVLTPVTSGRCCVDGTVCLGTLLAAAADTGAILLPLPAELCSIVLASTVTAEALPAPAIFAAVAWLSASRAAPQPRPAG